MAALIASGTTAANSADIVLADGASATLSLVAGNSSIIPAGCRAHVQLLTSTAGVYLEIPGGSLNNNSPVCQVFGPATFRVVKFASADAFGVDKT